MSTPDLLPLVAAAFVGCSAPLVGVFVVSRRQAFLADALAHVSLAGVALAVVLHTAPLPVTLLTVAAVALLLEELSLRRVILAQEALLATALSGALALANVLLASQGVGAETMEALLFGDLSAVTAPDILVLAVYAAAAVTLVILARRRLFLLSLDRDIAAAAGLPVGAYSRVLAVLVACMVVLVARTVGVLLCGALLVVPALTARLLARTFHQTLITAVVAGEVAVLSGFFLAHIAGIPPESTMVLCALAVFFVAFLSGRNR